MSLHYVYTKWHLLFAVIYISIASSICIHILAWSMFRPYTMSESKRKHPKKCEGLKLQ